MLTISDNDTCLTQGMLCNRISCVRGIVIMKVNLNNNESTTSIS